MKLSTTSSVDGKELSKTSGLAHGQAAVFIAWPVSGAGNATNQTALLQALYAPSTFTSMPGGLGLKKPPTPISALVSASGVSTQKYKKPEEYLEMISEAREEALKEMEKQAVALKANAVVGVEVKYESLTNGSLLVTATGTAGIV